MDSFNLPRDARVKVTLVAMPLITPVAGMALSRSLLSVVISQ
jgi:hypothetical protein